MSHHSDTVNSKGAEPVIVSRSRLPGVLLGTILILLALVCILIALIWELFHNSQPILVGWAIPMTCYLIYCCWKRVYLKKFTVHKYEVVVSFWGIRIASMDRNDIEAWSEHVVYTRYDHWNRLNIYTNKKTYTLDEICYKNYHKIKQILLTNKSQIEYRNKFIKNTMIVACLIGFFLLAKWISDTYWNPVLYQFHGV